MITKEEALKFAESIVTTDGEDLICEVLINHIYSSIVPEDTKDDKDPWAWVKTEYCQLFKNKHPDKGGKVRESTARMKKMFAADPSIRKEDVIGTTQLYLSSTDMRYIRFPHYFLKKGVGANAIYEFADWYEKFKEASEGNESEGRSSVTNTMQ